MNKFFWKKKTFSNTYQIFQSDDEVGVLETPSFFSKTSKARLKANAYLFVSKNWRNTRIHVFKNEDSEPMAEIKLLKLRTRAEISYKEKRYHFKFINLWQTKWEITENDRSIIKSTDSSASSGKVNINSEDNELLLLALYASNYYYAIGLLLITVVIVLVITT